VLAFESLAIASPNATRTYRFTSPKFYRADSKLVPSGLLGPVSVMLLYNPRTISVTTGGDSLNWD
jgi:hypothetical protein